MGSASRKEVGRKARLAGNDVSLPGGAPKVGALKRHRWTAAFRLAHRELVKSNTALLPWMICILVLQEQKPVGRLKRGHSFSTDSVLS